ADRLGGAVAQLADDLVDPCVELFARHDMAHGTQLPGFPGIEQVAGEQEFAGLAIADHLGPEEAPAVCRIQANPDVRVADARIFVHHGDVAKQGQYGAQTDGIAVDAADDGNFAIQHGVDDALGYPGHDLELFRFADGRAHPF